MRKFGFIVLMMLLPLQSAWAAAHLYHSHGSGESLVEAVFHNQHGDHAHDQSISPNQDDRDQSNATDPHHHVHVHTVSMLSEVNMPNFPSPSAVQHSKTPAWQEALFSERIERPNWR